MCLCTSLYFPNFTTFKYVVLEVPGQCYTMGLPIGCIGNTLQVSPLQCASNINRD